ncbi:MAG TPA: EAL domain-containing protein [Acidobacteriaceae bacterium]|jgi:diguanylate cyclase (GGDEF)-like protein/PAS domain S-box-containing protein|nr:EAL domain-containing protein [Acidobacteriaceae bacterium]
MQNFYYSLVHEHDPRLLLLAFAVCVIGCMSTSRMLWRSIVPVARVQRAWRLSAALVFACTIFSTHYIAILAFRPGVGMDFDIWKTALSLCVAVFGSMLGFLVLSLSDRGALRTGIAGILVGGTIAAMHFTGMAAMHFSGNIVWNHATVWLSIALGILLSVLALACTSNLHTISGRIQVSSLLVLAVCTLHFLAMSAMHISASSVARAGMVLNMDSMALTTAAVSLLFALISISATIVDHHISMRSGREVERLRQLADGAFEGIVLCREDQIIDVNLAFCVLLGLSAHTLRDSSISHLASSLYRSALQTTLSTPTFEPIEMELCTSNGSICPVEALSRPIEYLGKPATVLAVRDISERKLAQHRIDHLIHHDALTNLANRLLFQDRLQQAMAEADRTGQPMALLYIDLDRFKSVNDMLGHATGDDLLVQVAARMQETTRRVDTVARLGGDEFAIVQPLIHTPQAAATLASRLINLIHRPVLIGGHQVSVGASIGIAMYPQDGATPEILLQNADLALYRAKQYRGSSFCFFESNMDHKLQERRALEIELQEALENHQLHLNYQPLFSTGSLQLIGFEALLRWQHPQRGWIAPIDFIPLAEETGLILSIGRWVLLSACTEAARWSYPYRISVNVSAVQVQHSNLVETVAEILQTTGLPPDQLELEVTESLFLGDLEAILTTLRDLKKLGVRITLDDFGTGYSSLSYLRRFPFDHLKIDRSFVHSLGQDKQADAIVSSIVALSHSLNLSVTAEGVETETQLAALQSNDCDHVQGFLLGRPSPSSALASLRESGQIDASIPLGPFCTPIFLQMPISAD